MITSPIKSIIKNLTDKKYTTPVTSRMRIVLEPKGQAGDTARVDGDVFTLMDRTAVVEALLADVLDKKVSLLYVVDKVAELQENNDTANINSSVTFRDRVTALNKPVSKATQTKKQEVEVEVAEVIESEPTDSKVEEQETPEVKQEPVEEPAKEVVTDTAEETPEVKPEPEKVKEASTKQTKKPRQIKIN